MKSRIQKWGNSLAVRIPRPYANAAGLEVDTPVEVEVINGQLVIKPLDKPEYELDELLDQISADNRHDEIDTGTPQGNEVW